MAPVTFRDFIQEKPMNGRTFADVETRLGGTATVGFEFEVAVPADHPFTSSDAEDTRDTQAISWYDSLNEFDEMFDLATWDKRAILGDYDEWLNTMHDEWVDDNWHRYIDDSIDGDAEAETAAREVARNRIPDKDFEFRDWLKAEFKHNYDFVQSYGLDPMYGWANEDGRFASIYTEPEHDNVDEIKAAKNMADDLRHVVDGKIVVLDDYHGERKNSTSWYIEPDGSISGGAGLEIVSPPQHLEKALIDLENVCEWISGSQLVTNASTGLHVGVSIPGIEAKIDWLKLMLFMGESHVARVFDRESNSYAMQHIPALLAKIQVSGKIPKEFTEMQQQAEKYLRRQNDKYHSVNLGKLDEGYLEFRIAGGADYHRNIKLLRSTVLRYVTVVELACDPTAEKEEYAKKVAKLFDNASTQAQQPKTTPSDSIPLAMRRVVAMAPKASQPILDLETRDDKQRPWLIGRLLDLIATAVAAVDRSGTTLQPKEIAYIKQKIKQLNVMPNVSADRNDLNNRMAHGDLTRAQHDYIIKTFNL